MNEKNGLMALYVKIPFITRKLIFQDIIIIFSTIGVFMSYSQLWKTSSYFFHIMNPLILIINII